MGTWFDHCQWENKEIKKEREEIDSWLIKIKLSIKKNKH